MRYLRTALACLAAFAAVTVAAVPAEAAAAILGTKATFTGQSTVAFQVRPGERYLQVDTSAPLGQVSLEVKTATGMVRFCQNSKGVGPLSVDGLDWVHMRTVLNDPACATLPPAVTGTIIAYFSRNAFTLVDAYERAQADTTRGVLVSP